MTLPPNSTPRSLASRQRKNRIFTIICQLTAATSVVILIVLLASVAVKGMHYLSASFLQNPPSSEPDQAGMFPAIIGSIWICAVCGLTALPIGVATAVFLEEYKPKKKILRKLHGFLQLNIANLAGVPSIVYGIIGLTIFVNMFGLFGENTPDNPRIEFGVRWVDEYYDLTDNIVSIRVDGQDAPTVPLESGMDGVITEFYGRDDDEPSDTNVDVTIQVVTEDEVADMDEATIVPGMILADEPPERMKQKLPWYVRFPLGRSVLAGGLTLMLVILPVVIVASQEAIRSVPPSLREGAYGVGATKWQTIWRMVLPASVPGIMTGSILAMSRAIGEAAPMLVISAVIFTRFVPKNLMDEFTAMPLQIYRWAGLPQEEFANVAASGIIVLLAVLLAFNGVAVFVRHKFQRPLQ